VLARAQALLLASSRAQAAAARPTEEAGGLASWTLMPAAASSSSSSSTTSACAPQGEMEQPQEGAGGELGLAADEEMAGGDGVRQVSTAEEVEWVLARMAQLVAMEWRDHDETQGGEEEEEEMDGGEGAMAAGPQTAAAGSAAATGPTIIGGGSTMRAIRMIRPGEVPPPVCRRRSALYALLLPPPDGRWYIGESEDLTQVRAAINSHVSLVHPEASQWLSPPWCRAWQRLAEHRRTAPRAKAQARCW
jgi:hypothetical protein